ncbi:MAG: HAMP domain-containing histidine kinase [Clostridia bacterium]|nr:HAMP domain-containing histidine kinase [Clostridia bacterium]
MSNTERMEKLKNGFSLACDKAKSFALMVRKNIFTGITRRWLFNVFGVIFLVVVLLFSVMTTIIQNFYYSECISTLRGSGEYMARYFEDHIYPQYHSVSAGFMAMVEDFEDKSTMEMQVISLNGNTILSSTGFEIEELNETPDLLQAREGKSGSWIGYNAPSDERVVSVSLPLYTDDGIMVGSVRMMSSLRQVDRTLTSVKLMIFGLGAFIILLTAFTGTYFIKSIVLPVGYINETAREIAKGNMTARVKEIEKSDEIGQLCQTINTMAEELSQTERLKNEFISSISHELRTPLTAIRGWTETMLATEEVMDDTTRRGVEIIYSETERLSKMVEELLDMSRMQNGSLKLSVQQCDLLAEFEETVFMMSERAKSEQITIEYVPEEDSIPALVDKDRVKQVFFNVIDNAIKHSHPAGRIEIAARVQDQRAIFIIQDYGEGISEEDLPHIKDMFYKGSSQKRGSGIGLGVSDEIMRLHGGALEIESTLNVGTVVTISFPVQREDKIIAND